MDINLNGDMAEGFGAYDIGADEALLGVIGSANVACGYHAGDPTIMRRFVARAKAAGVSVGAHPGFADLQGFGRRRIAMDPAEVEDMIIYQIGALQAVCAAEGVRVGHVKPHGALANMAAEDNAYADAITRATLAADRDLILVALAGSEQEKSALNMDANLAREGYADRLYSDDGNLADRRISGSLFHEPARAIEQALGMVFDRQVVTRSGKVRSVEIDTICVHGDGPQAVAIATAVRDALVSRGARTPPLDAMILPSTGSSSRDGGLSLSA